MSTDKFENIRPSFFAIDKKQALAIAGMIQPFAGDNSDWKEYKGVKEKDGWAICDGTVLKKADFPDLYAAIGDTWNSFNHPVDGAPTVGGDEFALPNYKGLFLGGVGNNGSTTYALGTFYDDATGKNGLSTTTTTVSWSSNNVTTSSDSHSHTLNNNGAKRLALYSDTQGTNSPKTTSSNILSGNSAGSALSTTSDSHNHTVNKSSWNSDQNAHGHAVTSTDAETRPKTAAVNYIICIVTNKAGGAMGVPEATEDTVGVTYETPRDNLVINGSFETWQRGTSLTSSDGSVSRYLADRFAFYSRKGLNATYERVENGNANIVSKYAAKVSNLENGVMENDTLDFFYQTIEASTFKQIKGATFTVSFWVRSSKAGQHSFAVRNLSNNKTLCMLYSITSPNVDQKIELTFKIPEDHTVAEGSNGAMVLRWGNHIGAQYRGEQGWNTGDVYGTSGQVQLFETAGDYFQIAEVKLEQGSNATAFKRAGNGILASEFALCQRYYEKSYPQGTFAGASTRLGMTTATAWNTERLGTNVKFSTIKRTKPIVSIWSNQGVSGEVSVLNTSASVGGGFYVDQNCLADSSFHYLIGGSGLTQGTLYTFHWVADAEF